MNKIGIYFAYWCREWAADYCYYIKKVSALGFDTLEIAPASLLDAPRSEVSEIVGTAEGCGIDLTYCIGVPPKYDIASEDEATRRDGIEFQKRLIGLVGEMGGKYLGGILYSAWPGSPSFGIDSKLPYLERSVSSMRKIINTAEDCGVTLCMEVVNRFEQLLLNQAYEAVDYCRAVDSGNIGVLLDTFHMNIEEDSFREAILTAGSLLKHFHIGETNRKTPGMGKMDWDSITSALKEIDYTGHIVMEPFVKMGGGVGGDIKVWRDLSNSADETEMDENAKNALLFIRSKMKN